jgi:hypothetical protein
MRVRPAGDDVPSPALVAAWLELGVLRTESVPLWAAHWIVAGYDGEHLVHLAGLHGDDPNDVRDVLPQALEECGAAAPGTKAVAAAVAFTDLASAYLSGRTSEERILRHAYELISRSGYLIEVMDLPLGELFGIYDEWDAGWGRTKESLADAIRKACEEQVAHRGRPAERGKTDLSG